MNKRLSLAIANGRGKTIVNPYLAKHVGPVGSFCLSARAYTSQIILELVFSIGERNLELLNLCIIRSYVVGVYLKFDSVFPLPKRFKIQLPE